MSRLISKIGIGHDFLSTSILVQLIYHLVLEFGALIRMSGLWWAENADYGVDERPRGQKSKGVDKSATGGTRVKRATGGTLV